MARVHPLLRLCVEQPQLLAEHAAAYGELLLAEGRDGARRVQRQALWLLLATAGVAIGVVLAGVALMLWAMLPAGAVEHGWVLVAVPLSALALGAAAAMAARGAITAAGDPSFAQVRQQAAADLALFHAARPQSGSAPTPGMQRTHAEAAAR